VRLTGWNGKELVFLKSIAFNKFELPSFMKSGVKLFMKSSF
jgi:hypothetical protein